jgi:hypothetical protein
MDEWVEQNPRATLYILAVSIILILVLLGFLWYYTTSQEYMKMVDRELLKEVVEDLRDDKKNKKAENITEVAEEAASNKSDDNGDNEFTIVEV